MFKKILILIIILLALVAIALGIRIYFTQDNQPSLNGELNEERGGIFGFLNFGGSNETPSFGQGNTDANLNTSSQDRSVILPTLRQITTTPISGATFISTTTVRYVDRGTGHIYDADLLSFSTEKVSNTTIPQVYNALWLKNGNGVLYQQLDNNIIKTTYINLIDPTGTSTAVTKEVVTTFLPDNISHIDISPDQQSVALLSSSSVAVGDPANIGTADFTLTGKEWLLDWIDTQNIFVTSKASAQTPGYGYSYSLSGSVTKELNGIRGLTTNTNSSHTLFSETAGNRISLSSFNRGTGETTPLSPATFPEKCTFVTTGGDYAVCGVPKNIPNTQLPDTWYQGVYSSEDAIGLYNLETTEYTVLHTPELSLDIITPNTSSDNKYLLFVNKKDLTLWTLNLENTF